MLLGARWAGPSAYYIKYYIYYIIHCIVLFIFSALHLYLCVLYWLKAKMVRKSLPPNTKGQITINKQKCRELNNKQNAKREVTKRTQPVQGVRHTHLANKHRPAISTGHRPRVVNYRSQQVCHKHPAMCHILPLATCSTM